MSAIELINQVAALPPEEKAKFIQLFHAMEQGPLEEKNASGWPDFQSRLHQIYGNKITPDSQSIIEEGRGIE